VVTHVPVELSEGKTGPMAHLAQERNVFYTKTLYLKSAEIQSYTSRSAYIRESLKQKVFWNYLQKNIPNHLVSRRSFLLPCYAAGIGRIHSNATNLSYWASSLPVAGE
jgi:hypothetical protein